MANEIISEIRLELDKLRADLKDAQKMGEDTAKKTGTTMGDSIEAGFTAGWKSVAGALAAAGTAIAGAFTLKESIAAASEQENAINSLNSSLALAGNFSAEASADFLAFAGSLQKTTTAADEAIVQGGALIATMGQLSGETLKRATAASLDLAAALNIDQASAFNMVAKAASGHAGALAKVGIETQKTGDTAKDFEVTLGALEKRFNGLARIQANTFAGALKQTQNQFGEVLEAIGNIIIQSPTTIAFLKAMAKAFEDMAAGITRFAQGRDLINELAKAVVELGKMFVTFIVAPLELVYNAGRIVFDFLKQAVQGAIVVIAKGLEVVTGLLAPFSDRFAEIHSAVETFAQSSTDTLVSFGQDTKESIDGIFNFDASAKADEFLTGVAAFTETVTPIVKENFQSVSDAAKISLGSPTFFQNFAQGFVDSTKSMGQATIALGAQIRATFVAGMATAFQAFGAALVKGENVLGAFGKAVLSVLGDIAIQFGSFFIAQGIGWLFVPGGQATGVGLIAAGAGLNILGGVLKALGGGGGAAAAMAAPSGGGGGVASGGGGGVAPAVDQGQSFNDTQRGEIGTNVVVNVQGNVFDRRETGLQIADAINEAFGSNGVTFATGNA